MIKDQQFLIPEMERELEETPFSAVHIASHGEFSGDVNNSFLLTWDGKLTMDNLDSFMSVSRFRKNPVDLLTLSACQTAAGDDRAALGLAGIAIKAGARSALATLWYVNDEASSRLVVEFYKQLKDKSNSKAEALQRAQLQLVNDRRYQHPSYWSPFLMIGNWL
jgi:CHAT domain-containing protein